MNVNRWAAPSLDSDARQFAFLSNGEQNSYVENIFEAARNQGYQQGLNEGKEYAQRELSQVVRCLHSYKAQLAAPLEQVDQTVLERLVKLATDLAEKVTRSTIEANPDLIKHQLDQALGMLSNTHVDISVAMNPEDARAVSNLVADYPEYVDLRIIPDHSVLRGDCVLKTSFSQIESRISEKIREIADHLLGDESGADQIHG